MSFNVYQNTYVSNVVYKSTYVSNVETQWPTLCK